MRTITALALLTAALLTGPATRGDEPAPAPAKPATAPAGKRLTDDELMKMVEDMGYEILKRPRDADKLKVIHIRVTRGAVDVPMAVSLNGDKTGLTAFVNFGKLGEVELGNSAALLKLLELNDAQLAGGKGKFLVNPTTKVLWMCARFENREITPKVLRDQIEAVVASVCEHVDAWDFAKWRRAAAAKPEAGK
jgi:hypothetical protein